MQMDVLISQMEMFASLIVIGFLVQRIGLLSDENITNFSAVLSKFIIPSMLVTVIAGGGTRGELLGSWKFLLCASAAVTVFIAFSFFVSNFMGFKQPRKNMNAIVMSYGNAGFIGIPLVTALFPETGAIPAALYLFVEAVACWVFGPVFAAGGEKKKIELKGLVTPLTISIALGVIMILLNIDLRGFVPWDTLEDIGGTTKYFACLYVGMDLGRKGFGSLLVDKRIFVSTHFKLIIFPVVGYLVFGKTGILTGDNILILILFLSTPTGMAVPILAEMGNGDRKYAIAGTLINTLLCIVSIPAVMYIVSLL